MLKTKNNNNGRETIRRGVRIRSELHYSRLRPVRERSAFRNLIRQTDRHCVRSVFVSHYNNARAHGRERISIKTSKSQPEFRFASLSLYLKFFFTFSRAYFSFSSPSIATQRTPTSRGDVSVDVHIIITGRPRRYTRSHTGPGRIRIIIVDPRCRGVSC